MSILPKINEYGFYEIRFESIGGLGANIAGKILAEAGIMYSDMNGSNFSSYGSEKKGTPVKVFIRFTENDKPIRINSPVEQPHLIAIFHMSLAKTLPVLQGLREDGVVVVNSDKTPDEVRDILKMPYGELHVINAIKIAVEEKVVLNVIMLGAITKAMNFLSADIIKQVIRDTFGKKYPQSVEGNIKAFDRGYSGAVKKIYANDGKYKPVPSKAPANKIGYENAPMGGTITTIASTLLKDNSSSRVGYIPVYHRDKCIDCAACEITCPDYCFIWEEGKDKKGAPAMVLKGIDYKFCKGCLRCVKACPTDALTMEEEEKFSSLVESPIGGVK